MAEPRGMEDLRSPRLGRHSPPWARRMNIQLSQTLLRAQPEAFYIVWSSHGLLGLGTLTSFTFSSVPKTGW